MLAGWHFLYEGVVKILTPKWTSLGYLMDSQGWFASRFQSMAGSQSTLDVVNCLNEWGLTLVGLGLIIGCFSRVACVGGMILLGMYWLSHPSFIGAEYMLPREGSYLWVDKNLVEMAALAVLYVFPTSRIFGLDGYIFKSKTNPEL
jgi:thiosulfate dehydrogenase [quinone] large subunit